MSDSYPDSLWSPFECFKDTSTKTKPLKNRISTNLLGSSFKKIKEIE